ncbi:MAG: hypothetical protein J6M43_02020 [Neisseriaceae bacterium]|nr:hypothetical protein [Neisseriaceae bacterium]
MDITENSALLGCWCVLSSNNFKIEMLMACLAVLLILLQPTLSVSLLNLFDDIIRQGEITH